MGVDEGFGRCRQTPGGVIRPVHAGGHPSPVHEQQQLVGMFGAIEKLATSPECLGCTFQGTAAEFPSPDHPGHEVAVAHKTAVRDRFATLAREAGLHDPDRLADCLLLLMDGAWVAARMYGPDNPARGLAATARTLIDAHR